MSFSTQYNNIILKFLKIFQIFRILQKSPKFPKPSLQSLGTLFKGPKNANTDRKHSAVYKLFALENCTRATRGSVREPHPSKILGCPSLHDPWIAQKITLSFPSIQLSIFIRLVLLYSFYVVGRSSNRLARLSLIVLVLFVKNIFDLPLC